VDWLVLRLGDASELGGGGGRRDGAKIAGTLVLAVAADQGRARDPTASMEIGRGSQGWQWFSLVWLFGVSGRS